MRILCFLLLLATSISLNAQISKGNWLVGGDVSFSYSKSKPDSSVESETFEIDFSPNIGYFFMNQLAVGSQLDFFVSRYKSDTGSSNFETLFISPFIKYYFQDDEKIFNPFIESSYRFSLLDENNLKQFSAKGGLAIFVNESVAYEVFLNYLNSTTSNQYAGNHTLLLGFGIQIHLKKR